MGSLRPDVDGEDVKPLMVKKQKLAGGREEGEGSARRT